MAEISKAELLRALGRVVTGLSALFWGLPFSLIIYVQTARTDWLEFFGEFALLPAVVLSCMLWYGLVQLRQFQKQERVWILAINRAEVFALTNIGLSPFLFWWHRAPGISHFSVCVAAFVLSSLLFLLQLNRVLQRLTAMLPDEALRAETRTFTDFNIAVLAGVFVVLSLYLGLLYLNLLPSFLGRLVHLLNVEGVWLLLFMILLPLAMTMALIWKIKQMIFGSVFDADH